MRRFTKIFAFFLTFVIAFSFTACKKKGDDKGSDKGNDNVQEEFEKMQEVLQKEGFEVVDDFDPAAAEMKAQLEAENADGPAIEFHMLKDSKAMTSGAEPAANALVAEFRKADDIINFCKNSDIVRRYAGDIADSDDARAIYDRLKEGGYISGKCLIIPIPVQEEEDRKSVV